MQRTVGVILYAIGATLIAASAIVLLLEARLLFGWDIWSLPVWSWLGPYPRIIIQIEGAIYALPAVAFLLARAGFAAIGRANTAF